MKYRLQSNAFPRNITITQADWKTFRPKEIPRRLTVYFQRKAGMTQPIDEDIALFLLKGHDNLKMIAVSGDELSIKDELDTISWSELQHEAALYNIKSIMVKRDKVILDIRTAIADGVHKLTEEEYTEVLAKKKEKNDKHLDDVHKRTQEKLRNAKHTDGYKEQDSS